MPIRTRGPYLCRHVKCVEVYRPVVTCMSSAMPPNSPAHPVSAAHVHDHSHHVMQSMHHAGDCLMSSVLLSRAFYILLGTLLLSRISVAQMQAGALPCLRRSW